MVVEAQAKHFKTVGHELRSVCAEISVTQCNFCRLLVDTSLYVDGNLVADVGANQVATFKNESRQGARLVI